MANRFVGSPLTMQDFLKLRVWHSSQDLAVATYEATRAFPKDEMYGLVSQMRRSAVSVSSNIAEACGRDGPGEFVRFLQFAIGSLSELLSQIHIANRLAFVDDQQAKALLARANRTKSELIRLRETAKRRIPSKESGRPFGHIPLPTSHLPPIQGS